MNDESVDVRLVWRDHEGLPWEVSLRFASIDGKVQCAGMAVYPLEGSRPLTTTLVRSLPVGRLIGEALQDPPLDLARLGGAPPFSALVALAEENRSRVLPKSALSAPSTPRRGRPRKYGPEHHARVAQIYLDATGSPTTRVAEHFEVPYTRAANWVRTARELGLLDAVASDTPQGPAEKQRSITDPGVVKRIRKAVATDEQ